MKKTKHLTYLVIFLLPSFLYGQQTLKLKDCSYMEFEINDHSDSDDDGNVCEAKFLLINSAYYTDNEVCELSNIKWNVRVDLWNDGTDDLEYSSSLPSNDTFWDDTNGNGIPDIYIPMTSNNEVQGIQLPDIEGPLSIHKVYWSVSDDCDLGDLCVADFLVADRKAPTPFCVSLSTVIFDGSLTEIFAKDFNVGVYDNCTGQEDIRISFSDESIVPTRIISCHDVINSPIQLQVYFWDNNDNIELCTVFLSVIPEGPGSDCLQEGEIFGVVKGWDDKPIEGVEVQLSASLPEFPLLRITDADGKYSFGTLPNHVDYTLSASYDDNYLSEISTLDLVIIIRYMLGIESFTNPYRIVAADINGDNKVTVSDGLALRKLVLGIITEIPSNPPWKFFNSDFKFENPLDPFSSLVSPDEDPYLIEFKVIDSGGFDFIGVKTGNVND